MEEPSREPSAGSSEPPRPNDDSNARTGVIEDRDWSAGRLSVVEADTAAAAFRPSWETDECAPITQFAHDVATTPAPTKSFGEAPAPLIAEATEESAKAESAKAESAKAESAKAESAKAEPESAKGKNGHAKASKGNKHAKAARNREPASAVAPTSELAKAPPKSEPTKATPSTAKAPVARASDRPLSTAEVRAISSEITDGYPAIVPSSRPTKAILAGVAIVVVLVVGTVWSMTGSPEAPTTNASPSATGPSATGPSATGPSATGPSATGPATTPSPPSAPTLAPERAVPEPEPAEPAATAAPTNAPAVEEPVAAPEPPTPPVEVRVTVRTVPAGASLTLDGAPVTSPIVRPQELLATSHTLEVRAEGYEPRSETVRFDRDGAVRVELRRVPPPVVTMAPEPPTAMAATTMASTAMTTPSMSPVRITTMAPATPMRATMAAGAGFTTDNPY